jgi:hypothetical protein
MRTKRQQYESTPDQKAAKILAGIRTRSKVKNMECNLDRDWLSKKLEAGICELTDLPFKMDSNHACAFSPSVERIIPEKGYTKTNCRVILLGLNALKNSGTYKDALLIAKQFIKNKHRIDL